MASADTKLKLAPDANELSRCNLRQRFEHLRNEWTQLLQTIRFAP